MGVGEEGGSRLYVLTNVQLCDLGREVRVVQGRGEDGEGILV